MQLATLRSLCGPEVQIFTEANLEEVSKAWEAVLVLDVDGAERAVTVTGPVGSLDRLLRAIEEELGVVLSEEGKGRVGRGNWRGLLTGINLRESS